MQSSQSKGTPGFEEDVQRVGRRRRGWRSPFLTLAVSVFAIFLAWSYRAELAYFFADDAPVELGEGEDLSSLEHNTYARIGGLYMTRRQVSYEQLGREFRVYHLIGTPVFVREALGGDGAPRRFTEDVETVRVSGRVLDLSRVDEYDNVKRFFGERGWFEFDRPAWILLAGVEPGRQWQYPALVGLLVLIALGNLAVLVGRLVKRR